jgi:hypothetical protein
MVTHPKIIMSHHHQNSHQTGSVAQADVQTALTHDEIEPCARELWEQQGCPENRDEAIWLEAESRLQAARHGATRKLPAVGSVQ